MSFRQAFFFIAMSTVSATAFGQGCVAAHSPQPSVAGLGGLERPANQGNNRLHGLTVTVGYREFSSKDHYVGTVYQVQRATAHNRVQNHEAFYDLGLSYQLTPRLSLTADIPSLSATRHQEGTQNVYRAGGVGDVQVGAQTWDLSSTHGKTRATSPCRSG